ncbi:MAG: hypothetical protein ACP5TL_00640 [Candidatus Micrarchaeia archaeon]
MRYAIVALALLSMLTLVPSAQTTTCSVFQSSQSLGNYMISNAIPLSALGIAVSLMIVAIAYMIGEVFNYSGLKGWYKTELWEVVKSIIIIIVVFSSLIIASAIAEMMLGFPSSSIQTSGNAQSLENNLQGLCNSALSYLGYNLYNQVYVDFATMLGVSQGLALLKSIQVGTWVPVPIIILPYIGPVLSLQFGSLENPYVSSYIETLTPTAVFSIIKDMFTMILFPLLYLFLFQFQFLGSIMGMGIGILLPIGIILRAMPFTRGIGGTLIALGIGLSLVYPVLLVGFNTPISAFLQNILPTQPSTQFSEMFGTSLLGQMLNYVVNAVSALISAPLGGILVPIVLGPNVPLNAAAGYVAGVGAGFFAPLLSNIVIVLNFVIDQTIYLVMQLFLFIFDVIIGLAIVNQIAKLLGGTLSISQMGIGKMKLS